MEQLSRRLGTDQCLPGTFGRIHAALKVGDYPAARNLNAAMQIFEDIRAQEINGTNVASLEACCSCRGRNAASAPAPGLADEGQLEQLQT